MKTYTRIYNFAGILVIIYGLFNAIYYRIFKERSYLFLAGLCQTFFIAEILNISIGASRSTYMPTILQTFSRLYVVWIVAYYHKIENLSLTIMLVCWNISDLIRYTFYLFRANWLRFLRYNAFIILYPVGICLEIYLTNCVYLNYDGFVSLLFKIVMVMYLPLSPYLYYHMIKQRRRSKKIFGLNKRKKRA